MAGRTRPVSPCLLCHESPEDETYPQLDVNYVRLDRPPKFSEGWPPVFDALRAGTSSSLQARCYCAIIQFRGPRQKHVRSGRRLDSARRVSVGRRQNDPAAKLSGRQPLRRSQRIDTASRSMQQAKSGYVLRSGIRRATERSPSRCIPVDGRKVPKSWAIYFLPALACEWFPLQT